MKAFLEGLNQGMISSVRSSIQIEGDPDAVAVRMSRDLARFRERLDATSAADIELTRSLEADALVNGRMPAFVAVLRSLVESIRGMDQAIGHDRIHLAYDMYEACRALDAGDVELGPCETFIVLMGGVSHDLGRYAEEKIFGKPMASDTHVWLAILLLEQLSFRLSHELEHFKDLGADERRLYDAIWNRILGCVAAHFGPNAIEDPLRWMVQSFDRLAGIFGVRCFARNIVCDFGLRGAAFWPNRSLSSAWEMSPFNNVPPERFACAATMKEARTNVVHYVEAPMRTAYPLANSALERRADALKVQAGKLLMCLGGRVVTDPDEAHHTLFFGLGYELFTPEIVAYVPFLSEYPQFSPRTPPDKLTRWDKDNKVLPERVWKVINELEEYDTLARDCAWRAWAARNNPNVYREPRERVRMLLGRFLSRNAYTLDDRQRYDLTEKILAASVSLCEVERLLAALAFALAAGEEVVHEERAVLAHAAGSADPFVAAVAQLIASEPIFCFDVTTPYSTGEV